MDKAISATFGIILFTLALIVYEINPFASTTKTTQSVSLTNSTKEQTIKFEIPDYDWLYSENWIKPDNNPVLYPTQNWEGDSVLEPTVIYEDGIFKMWYCGGVPCALGYATSKDGINWEKHPDNPIFGYGKGGEEGAARQNSIFKYNGIYYLYYGNKDGDLYAATSSDGINFTKNPTPILKHSDTGWSKFLSNTFQWSEDDKFYMIYAGSEVNPLSLWKTSLATGISPYEWKPDLQYPLHSLQRGTGAYGGPWATQIDGVYYLFYHASKTGDNLPTEIYISYSKDLRNWFSAKEEPVVKITQHNWEIDQTADPHLLEVNGRTYLFYDGNDNTVETGYRAWIGYVYYNGTFINK